MRTLTKNNNSLNSVLSKLHFKEINKADLLGVTDDINIPIVEQDHSGVYEIDQAIEFHSIFADSFVESLDSNQFNAFLCDHEYHIGKNEWDSELFKLNYLNLIKEITNRSGFYINAHNLAFELTHYKSKFSVSLRVGLIKTGNHTVKPVIIANFKVYFLNKFDRKLNKELIFDTIQLH
jgi:hypothetical protein